MDEVLIPFFLGLLVWIGYIWGSVDYSKELRVCYVKEISLEECKDIYNWESLELPEKKIKEKP